MNAVTFDTLKLARTLQGDGVFTEAQSERLIEALGDVFAADLATKRDLGDVADDLRVVGSDVQGVRGQLRDLTGDVRNLTGNMRDLTGDVRDGAGKIRELELRLETKIAEAKAATIKWFFGVVGIQTVAIIGSLVAVVNSVRHA
jgi:hypothetical protein